MSNQVNPFPLKAIRVEEFDRRDGEGTVVVVVLEQTIVKNGTFSPVEVYAPINGKTPEASRATAQALIAMSNDPNMRIPGGITHVPVEPYMYQSSTDDEEKEYRRGPMWVSQDAAYAAAVAGNFEPYFALGAKNRPSYWDEAPEDVVTTDDVELPVDEEELA